MRAWVDPAPCDLVLWPRPALIGWLHRTGEAVRAGRFSALNTTRFRAGFATLVIGGLAATSAFTTGHTAPPTRTDFVSGTAWLASFVPGQVTLLDGSTGAIVDQLSGSRLPGVRPGDHIEVAQAGSGAYVADTHTGVLDRIDGATHDVVSATGVVAADGAAIQMYPAKNHLFVVDPRRGRRHHRRPLDPAGLDSCPAPYGRSRPRPSWTPTDTCGSST